MIARALILLVVGILTGADAPARDAEKQELEKLQGTWTIVSVEIRGKKSVPDEHTRDFKAVIDGNKLTAFGGGQAPPHTSTIRIDPSKSPKRMDHLFERGGKTTVTLGIYKLEGDTLTVCSALAGGERPERFESTEETTLTVLKRAGK